MLSHAIWIIDLPTPLNDCLWIYSLALSSAPHSPCSLVSDGRFIEWAHVLLSLLDGTDIFYRAFTKVTSARTWAVYLRCGSWLHPHVSPEERRPSAIVHLRPSVLSGPAELQLLVSVQSWLRSVISVSSNQLLVKRQRNGNAERYSLLFMGEK